MKQFREPRAGRTRERWPLDFDLSGIERDTQVRNQKKQELEMPVPLVTNRFVSGKVVDINNPQRAPYNPFDPKNEFPKMLYHPTEKHPAWVAEHKRLTLYNALHPEKPELLPTVPAKNIIVKSKEEESAKLRAGWSLKPPAAEPQVEEEAGDEEGAALCSRGCGNPPHRGSCKMVQVSA
jgi:hypothetical protein